jgi:molybdopterin molybdotransferase
MLAFEEARSRLLASVARLPAEAVPVAQAAGRVLAEDLVASEPLPAFDHSAMDGYAIASALEGAGPWSLPVRGESSAGRPASALAGGAACRIFTGAAVPAGADAVVMQEHVTREGDSVTITVRPRPGQNIRRAGEDIARGAVAIAAGTRLSAGGVALAAMLDRADVAVVRRPRVVVLCTGDELRPAGSAASPATIPESNSGALAALARQAGADVRVAPIVRDEPGTVDRAIAEALEGGADVLVTVGGVSVGDYDVVRPALERAGVTLDYWKVAIKPGKPLAVGRRQATHVLGLPGNPASAIVTFALFGGPLLRALAGDARSVAQALPVRLEAARKRPADRMELVRATLHVEGGLLVARAHDNQSSGAATSLASSDGIAFVPAGEGPVAAGTLVDFLRWSDA